MSNQPISIPDEEDVRRSRGAQSLLRESDLEGLLINSNEGEFANVRCFSNYWPISETAGVVISRKRDPALLIAPESETYARDRSRIDTIHKLIEVREPAEHFLCEPCHNLGMTAVGPTSEETFIHD